MIIYSGVGKIGVSLTDYCIVLDMDETLVHTHEDNDGLDTLDDLDILRDPELDDLRQRTYVINFTQESDGISFPYTMWGTTRPYLKEFLSFCFSFFKLVVIWSAGKTGYVKAIVDYMFRDLEAPHIVYTDVKCVTIRDEEKGRDIMVKPLAKLIQEEPQLERYMTLDKTLIVDDRWSTFRNINDDNGILIPPYEPESTIEDLREPDDTLLRLMYWLTSPGVVEAKDVRRLDKTHVFDEYDERKLSHNMLRLLSKSTTVKKFVLPSVSVTSTSIPTSTPLPVFHRTRPSHSSRPRLSAIRGVSDRPARLTSKQTPSQPLQLNR